MWGWRNGWRMRSSEVGVRGRWSARMGRGEFLAAKLTQPDAQYFADPNWLLFSLTVNFTRITELFKYLYLRNIFLIYLMNPNLSPILENVYAYSYTHTNPYTYMYLSKIFSQKKTTWTNICLYDVYRIYIYLSSIPQGSEIGAPERPPKTTLADLKFTQTDGLGMSL